jgi:hypothetical protein
VAQTIVVRRLRAASELGRSPYRRADLAVGHAIVGRYNRCTGQKMSTQAAPRIDDRQYGRILSRMCPRPIRNDRELEQAVARLDELDRRD